MQDLRDLLVGVLGAVFGPLLVLRLGLQHADEGLFHRVYGTSNLPDEVQGALLHNL